MAAGDIAAGGHPTEEEKEQPEGRGGMTFAKGHSIADMVFKGEASRDMNCECDLVTTLRGNDASFFTRKNLIRVVFDNDTWRGLYRCKTCQAWFEETFEEARFVDIPVLKKVDEEYIKTHWEILNLTCDSCREFGEISDFGSISQFERFVKHIEDNVKGGKLTEISVENRYAGFPEQWFKCTKCSQVWRLVHPDFPFKGFWRIVYK